MRILIVGFLLFVAGCTSQVLVKDCERQGTSQYYHCTAVRGA